VRESFFSTTRALEGVLQLSGLLLQIAITAAILIALNPWLAFLPPIAVPPVLSARRAQASYERARERTAGQLRLTRHLLDLSTDARSVKELRIFGTEDALLARQEAAWQMITARMWRGQAVGAPRRGTGQLIFTLGYGWAIPPQQPGSEMPGRPHPGTAGRAGSRPHASGSERPRGQLAHCGFDRLPDAGP
jgi:hypothetical protein